MEMQAKDRSFEPKMRDQEATTTLGPDTEFTGTLKFGKTLKVEGKFEGDLESQGMIIVAPTGRINAKKIDVGSAIIEGKVTGPVSATELVELRSNAELQGDIKSKRLKIDDGVIFVGHCDVNPKREGSSSSSSSSSSSASSTPTASQKK